MRNRIAGFALFCFSVVVVGCSRSDNAELTKLKADSDVATAEAAAAKIELAKARAEAATARAEVKRLQAAAQAIPQTKAAAAKLDGVSAEKEKAAPQKKRTGEEKQVEQNDLVLAFVDNPGEFADRELTARVRYGSRETYLRMLVTLQERAQAGWDKDRDGNDLIPFFGYAGPGKQAKLDLKIGIPRNLAVPNASPGDELLVTFKCGTHPQFGNLATKIARPTK